MLERNILIKISQYKIYEKIKTQITRQYHNICTDKDLLMTNIHKR